MDVIKTFKPNIVLLTFVQFSVELSWQVKLYIRFKHVFFRLFDKGMRESSVEIEVFHYL